MDRISGSKCPEEPYACSTRENDLWLHDGEQTTEGQEWPREATAAVEATDGGGE